MGERSRTEKGIIGSMLGHSKRMTSRCLVKTHVVIFAKLDNTVPRKLLETCLRNNKKCPFPA
jgi:hypothetical protein